MEQEVLQRILNELREFRTETNQRLDNLEAGQSETNQRLDNLEVDVSDLKSDVSGLKDDVSNLKSDVSDLKENVLSVKGLIILMEHEQGKKLDILIDSKLETEEELSDIRLRLLRLEQQ